MMDIKRYPRESLRDEKGMILVVSLMLISVLLLLGTTAVMTSTTDMKISANYKTGIQASYVAEAGIEEARARMGADFLPATGATGQIVDSSPTSTTWSVSIGGGRSLYEHSVGTSLYGVDRPSKKCRQSDPLLGGCQWGRSL